MQHMAMTQLRFSALQRAEIAEMQNAINSWFQQGLVSVLFNEPKLLKLIVTR